jgi:hypothetical protein
MTKPQKDIIISIMIQRLLSFLVLSLALFSPVSSQEALPENLGTDTYSVQYQRAFEALGQFRNQNPAVRAYENKLNPLQRALEALKNQLRDFIASFKNTQEIPPPTNPSGPIVNQAPQNQAPTGPNCATSQPPILNGNEDRTILAQGANNSPKEYNGLYNDIYNNSGLGNPTPWPGPLGNTISLNLEKNKYIAAKFTAPNESIDGKFLTQVPSNAEGVPPSGYTVAISECPGDFNVHLNQPACKWGYETFKWSTTPNPPGPPGFFCELEQGKTYYLNIVHSRNAENDNYATTKCLARGDSCGHLASQNLVIIGNMPQNPPEPTGPNCAVDQPPILNGNEDHTILAQGANKPPKEYNGLYEDIYNNSGFTNPTPWPGSWGTNLSLNLEKNKYIAAKFTAPNEEIDARFLSQIPSNHQGVPPSGYTIAISKCPGDFNIHLDQNACKYSGATFKWSSSTNPSGPPGFFCKLQQGQDYYLNIVHSTNSENDNYATTKCLAQGDSCGHLAQQSYLLID